MRRSKFTGVLWNMKITVIQIVIGPLRQSLKDCKETGRFGNMRTCGHHPEYGIIKIHQNTEKSPEDLRKFFFFTKTPVENYQLTLV